MPEGLKGAIPKSEVLGEFLQGGAPGEALLQPETSAAPRWFPISEGKGAPSPPGTTEVPGVARQSPATQPQCLIYFSKILGQRTPFPPAEKTNKSLFIS